MEVPHLAEEPGQVFFDFRFIPRPMNVFLKKLQVNEGVRERHEMKTSRRTKSMAPTPLESSASEG
jgi:hypothetical protein